MSFAEKGRATKESPEMGSPERRGTASPNPGYTYESSDSSPRGVLEIPISGTDSEHSSSSSSSSGTGSPLASSTAEKTTGHVKQWKNMIDALKRKSVRRFSTIPLLVAASYDLSSKNFKKGLTRISSAEDGTEESYEIPFIKPSWRNFDMSELAAATDNFSDENLLGIGGQAEVYRGCLSNGQLVAVKRLMKNFDKDNQEIVADFLSELGIIAHINHPNTARLLGYGVEGGLHLVLEFSPHGSLASLLFPSSDYCLEWKIRFKVALGVAEGLRYLHHDCQRRIIHRDIKASNILLTDDFEAQISDYGLAKWLPEKWTHHVVFPIEGTFGYLAPEYFMHGIVDEKTDVFAYGVLLLELVTGRRAVDSSQQSLVIWAKPLLDDNNIKELIDPKLGDAYDPTEMKRTMYAASMCIHHSSSMRPNMIRVAELLKGEGGPLELKQLSKHSSTRGKSQLIEACDLEDYTCSNYLNDLNRHRQLVLE